MAIDLDNQEPEVSWLERELLEHRIDAQFYKREFIENEEIIKKLNYKPLGDLYSKGDYGTLPDSSDYCKQGIFLIRGTDLRDLTVNDKELIVAPQEYYSEKSEALPGDILLLIKGATIDAEWSVSVVPSNIGTAIFNGSIFRVRLKQQYDPYYIAAFMSTKYFLLQKRRSISNTGIFYNDKDSIDNFIIPTPSLEIQKCIGEKIRQAEVLGEDIKKLTKETTDILLAEIESNFKEKSNINDQEYIQISEKPNILYVTTNLLDDSRIEASFYKRDDLEMEQIIIHYKHGYALLEDICKKITDGTHKTPNYVKDGVAFISSKNISEALDFEDIKYITKKEHEEISKRCNVKPGDVLLTKIGRIGYAKVVPENRCDFSIFVSVALLKLKENVDPYYVEAFLNSEYGKRQSIRLCKGSNQPDFHLEDIARIKVPIPPFEVQKLIGDRLRKIEKLQEEHKKLIKHAKQNVENFVKGKLI